MQSLRIQMIVLIAGALLTTGADAQELSAFRMLDQSSTRGAAFMRTFGYVQPPYGFVRFCQKSPEECGSDHLPEKRMEATPQRLRQLVEVNRSVNEAIAPATDLEIYGIKEYWTLPSTRGDCEDYALQKRRALIEKGWPVGSLLLTVVRDEKGEGHAVLTARTSQGDFILDNKLEEIRLWYTTPYRFVMRQSYINPRTWVALDEQRAPMASALSGVQDDK